MTELYTVSGGARDVVTPFLKGGNETGDQRELKAVSITVLPWEKDGTSFSRGGNETGDQRELKATPRFGKRGCLLRRRHTIRLAGLEAPIKLAVVEQAAGQSTGDDFVAVEVQCLQQGARVLLHMADSPFFGK